MAAKRNGRRATRRPSALGALGALAAMTAPAWAADQPAYPAKQIRLVIASGPGGGYDIYARILGAHLGEHLPGHPAIIPENMPGAAGLVAMNWAANSAPRDGSALVAPFNVALAEPLFGETSAKFDPRKFGAVGSVGTLQNICATWQTSAITTIAQASTRQISVAAEGAESNTATVPAILNLMLGARFKPIMGYSTKQMRLALERGEVEGLCGLGWTTLKASDPDWIENHRLHVLVQTGERKQPGLEDVPLLIDLVSDPQNKQILRALEFPEAIGRPFMMPPGTPEAVVNLMRRAFDETVKDPGFLADAARAKLDVEPVSGAQMAGIVESAYATPPDLIAKAAPFSGVQPK
jgi:tripartite-type tricarboxylate transporter receptor subunit TctC